MKIWYNLLFTVTWQIAVYTKMKRKLDMILSQAFGIDLVSICWRLTYFSLKKTLSLYNYHLENTNMYTPEVWYFSDKGIIWK